MNRMLLVIGVCFLLLLVSCKNDSNSAVPLGDVTLDTEGIQKSAIKYAIHPESSPLISYSSLFFVSFGEYSEDHYGWLTGNIDPSDELISQLRSEFYNVWPVSKGEFIFDENHDGIYDKSTGEQGLCISVGNQILEKVNDTTVNIVVEIFLGGLCAEGYIYTMQFNDGVWNVISVSFLWIS